MNPWNNNSIQFPRLIDEAAAAGAFSADIIETMAASMDLTSEEVESLIDRASEEFEKIKQNILQ